MRFRDGIGQGRGRSMQIHRVLSIKYSTQGDHVLSPTTSVRLFIAARTYPRDEKTSARSLPPFFSLLPLSIPRSISFPPRNGGNFEGNGGKGERGKGRERGKKERKEGEEVVVSQTVRKRLTPRIKWYRNETIVEQMPGHKTTASSFPPPIALSTPAEKAN